MGSGSNPFTSAPQQSHVANWNSSSKSEKLIPVPSPPARVQLSEAAHDYGAWYPPSLRKRSIVYPQRSNQNRYQVPPQSIYTNSIRGISDHSLPGTTSPQRPSSATDRTVQDHHSVYSEKTVIGEHWGNDSDKALPLPSWVPKKRSKSQRLRSCFSSAKRGVLNHVDPKAVLELIDFREMFWPFSWWKYTVLVLIAVAVAGIVVSEHYTHWIQTSMAITRSNMLAVLVVVIGLEPLMITVILLIARVPELGPEDTKPSVIVDEKTAAENDTKPPAITTAAPDTQQPLSWGRYNHRTALVIPCHNSDETAMKKVLQSAYPHFLPHDIFIVDNGRTKYPPNNFRKFIRDQHADIVYIWSPIGSKNAAQLVGALAAKNHDYIMTVDDDVSIPANFRPPIDKIDGLTKGVAFPLRAINADGKTPLFMVAWQDCEYKMSGLSKLAESSTCGVLYPHGAGWFCERDTLIDLISNYHSLDFIAEDVNTGISMQKMKKRIAFDARMVLETEVPTTILGPGLNWWQQRKNSWEMGRHGRLFGFAGRLFLSLNGQNTILGILTQKFVHCYAIASIVVDWVRVPVLVTMGGNVLYWRQALLLMLASMFPLLAFKYINARNRRDLQPGFWACVTYPFYKQLYAFVSIFGAIRSVTWYIGGHQKAKSVRTMMKENDERIFWKDPRFESNPSFLADEAELSSSHLHQNSPVPISGYNTSAGSLTLYPKNSEDFARPN